MTRRSSSALRWALPCLLTTGSALALAHTGHDGAAHHGIGDAIAAGFTHPFTGLDHLAAMLALGVWSALTARRVWLAPLAFFNYGGLVAVWVAERDDGSYWDAEWRTARSPRARRWLNQIAPRFNALFGDYECLGHMSNGEGVYRKRLARPGTGAALHEAAPVNS